jgi:hypothetical protein
MYGELAAPSVTDVVARVASIVVIVSNN